jgi:hypothetical protein
MSWQSFIGCVDEPQQLGAVALEVKPTSQELQFTPVKCSGPLAKRIGINVWNVAAILDDHRRLYSKANDSVKLFYANAA